MSQGSGRRAHDLKRDRHRSLGEGWRRLRADPAVPILVLTTLVHIVRRSPLDIVVFGGTALLIVVDRSTPVLGPLVHNRWLGELEGRWLDVAAIAFGLLVGSLAHGSWPVLLALTVPGVLAAVIVLRARSDGEVQDPAPPRAPPGSRTWVVLLIVAALWELSSFVQQPGPTTDSHDHPVLSTLIDPVLRSPWHRAIAIAVWFAIGGRLLRMVVAEAAGDEPDPVGRVQPHLHQGDAMSVRGVTIAVFVVIGLALLLLETLARRGVVRAPTFAQLLRWAMHKRSAQFAIVLAWWWIGAHFFYG